MNITYDAVADAVYLKVSKAKVWKTLKMEDRLIVDVDRKNNLVGIEILEASSQKDLVKKLERGAQVGIPVALTAA